MVIYLAALVVSERVDVNAEACGVAAGRRQRNKVMSVAAPF